MLKILNELENRFFSNYDKNDLLKSKKAKFVTIFNLFFLVLIFIVIFSRLNSSTAEIINTLKVVIPSATTVIISMIFIRKAKIDFATGAIAFVCFFIIVGGYIVRPPYIAVVTLGFFMYLDLVYAVLLSNKYVAFFILAGDIALNTYTYFFKSSSVTDPVVSEILNKAFVDGSVALVLVFVASYSVTKILESVVDYSKKESAANKNNFTHLQEIMKTLGASVVTLDSSSKNTKEVIEKLSGNIENQAAAIEEISATMEEIASGTENTERTTSDQSNSVNELVSSMKILSQIIDEVESASTDMKSIFTSFVGLASQGEKSSTILEQTNQRVLSNSNNIITVTSIIEDFFDKINLLALNASIEAARAGDLGRGFAVVADEIGKLSDSSAQELKRINDIIINNKKDVDESNQSITEILHFISNLVNNIHNIQGKIDYNLERVNQQKQQKSDMVDKISVVKSKSEMIELSMKEQKSAIEDISKSIENVNVSIQEISGVTVDLNDGSNNIIELTSKLNSELKKNSA